MTKTESRSASAAVKRLLLHNPDGLREVVRAVMQVILEAEMTESVGPRGRAFGRPARLPLRLSRRAPW
jgi:transposase-like protein